MKNAPANASTAAAITANGIVVFDISAVLGLVFSDCDDTSLFCVELFTGAGLALFPAASLFYGSGLTLSFGVALFVDSGFALSFGAALFDGAKLPFSPGVALFVGTGLTLGLSLALSVGSGLALDVGVRLALDVGTGLALDVGTRLALDVGVGLALDVGTGLALSVGNGEFVTVTYCIPVLLNPPLASVTFAYQPIFPSGASFHVNSALLPLATLFTVPITCVPNTSTSNDAVSNTFVFCVIPKSENEISKFSSPLILAFGTTN